MYPNKGGGAAAVCAHTAPDSNCSLAKSAQELVSVRCCRKYNVNVVVSWGKLSLVLSDAEFHGRKLLGDLVPRQV